MQPRIFVTPALAALVLALALSRQLAAGGAAPLEEVELADVVACGLREPLDAEGVVAWDDTQVGRAVARGGDLYLHVPEQWMRDDDTEGTVLLDGGRVSARVRLGPRGSVRSPRSCDAAVVMEASQRVDFEIRGPERAKVHACDQHVAIEGGRATVWVPPSRLRDGCTARVWSRALRATGPEIGVAPGDVGAVLVLEPPERAGG